MRQGPVVFQLGGLWKKPTRFARQDSRGGCPHMSIFHVIYRMTVFLMSIPHAMQRGFVLL